MNICKKCKKPMILMSGTICLEPDAEPYESGKEEELDIEIDKHVTCLFCQTCDSLQFLDTE